MNGSRTLVKRSMCSQKARQPVSLVPTRCMPIVGPESIARINSSVHQLPIFLFRPVVGTVTCSPFPFRKTHR